MLDNSTNRKYTLEDKDDRINDNKMECLENSTKIVILY